MHCDKHVVKMILETAQLLSTTHRILDGKEIKSIRTMKNGKKRAHKSWVHSDKHMNEHLYSASHVNHPCAIWLRESPANYDWTYQLFLALCEQYTLRYGKMHLSQLKLVDVIDKAPRKYKDRSLPFTQPPQAMPDVYKVKGDSVSAYRAYYIGDKVAFAKWAKIPNSEPEWWLAAFKEPEETT